MKSAKAIVGARRAIRQLHWRKRVLLWAAVLVLSLHLIFACNRPRHVVPCRARSRCMEVEFTLNITVPVKPPR